MLTDFPETAKFLHTYYNNSIKIRNILGFLQYFFVAKTRFFLNHKNKNQLKMMSLTPYFMKFLTEMTSSITSFILEHV